MGSGLQRRGVNPTTAMEGRSGENDRTHCLDGVRRNHGTKVRSLARQIASQALSMSSNPLGDSCSSSLMEFAGEMAQLHGRGW